MSLLIIFLYFIEYRFLQKVFFHTELIYILVPTISLVTLIAHLDFLKLASSLMSLTINIGDTSLYALFT